MGKSEKSYSVGLENFDTFYSHWRNRTGSLNWKHPFVLPGYLKSWWDVFGKNLSPSIFSVRDGEKIIGLAPLLVEGERACFIGDKNVCDYMDFIVAPGKGEIFFSILFNHLRGQGVTRLDLRPLRPDSTVLTFMPGLAKGMGWEILCEQKDVTYELELPGTWDGFLGMLQGKQRHEIRRKLRRLHETAKVSYRLIETEHEVREEIETFLRLFKLNRPDKAAFMTRQMACFFRLLGGELAKEQILKLFFLDLNDRPVAAVMCFEYNSTMYLYNNGYDQRHRAVSVGLLSKVLNIKASIKRGIRKYDFLKGDEEYKHRLGGKQMPLYRCRITFKK